MLENSISLKFLLPFHTTGEFNHYDTALHAVHSRNVVELMIEKLILVNRTYQDVVQRRKVDDLIRQRYKERDSRK